MSTHEIPEIFTVGERVKMWNDNQISSPRVTSVNGDTVTVSLFGKNTIFKVRASDGKHVMVGQEDSANPAYITHAPKQAKSAKKDALEFLHGFFWGWRA